MPSFASIATFATLAFAAVASAIPVNLPGLPAPDVTSLAPRCDSCNTAPGVIADLWLRIEADVTAVSYCTPQNATADGLGPIIARITAEVNAAVDVLVDFKGQPLDVVLGADITIEVFAAVCADIIIAIFACIKVVLSVCLDINIVIGLLVSLGNVCASLCVSLFACVDGLDVLVQVLVKACATIALQLNVEALVQVLAF